MEQAADTILEIRNISKKFPGVQVLSGMSFSVKAGEIHALLGENGAGKSTLMKIIMGQYAADEGEIVFNGEVLEGMNTAAILKKGISMVYQELNNLPYLTIAENVFVGREPKQKNRCFVDKKEMNRACGRLLKEFGQTLKPGAMMGELSVAQAQVIEIIKAVSRNARVVIMDEPTSSLSASEVEELYGTIRRLKSQGIAVIYISHRLEELFEIADRVTVLRDGQFIATRRVEETTKDELIRLMVGRELENLYPKQPAEIGGTVLEVRHLVRRGVVNDVSFSVRSGEILGISGLVGAGRSETARAIFGLDPLDSGEIVLEGRPLRIRSPRDAIRSRIVMASEDRKNVGLVLCRSVKENISLPNLKLVSKGIFLRKKREKRLTEEAAGKLSTKIRSVEQEAVSLSGGNQQKVVLSKWLLAKPKVMILDEPTRGIDVGAKAEIHRIISGLAAEGMAVIMISSELGEILGMSDRILVMGEGRIKGEFSREEVSAGNVSQEDILKVALGGNAG